MFLQALPAWHASPLYREYLKAISDALLAKKRKEDRCENEQDNENGDDATLPLPRSEIPDADGESTGQKDQEKDTVVV